MNAPIANNQFAFSLGNLSYIGPTYEETPASAVKRPERSFAAWLVRRLEGLTEWRRRRAVMQEMALMTDRELSDIGLSRSDLSRVFDPTFAADHARGREYIAY